MAMHSMLSYDNPLFGKFAFYSGVVIGKTLLMSALTVRQRLTYKIFVNPEDVAYCGGKAPTIGDQGVERVRRCHQNDIENVFPFVFLGFFYILTSPDPWWATLLFRVFALSRCLHTVCYLASIPQPSRFLTFMTGYVVTGYMAVAVIRAGRF
ncbi:microsomal glutathione S-transferase 1-like isoform X2 [Saccostrea echinata]|uniref:microsomal glutathione S-transferase 1-like isoform X2 n=1 Tax=Saccostrea echinata TaxID=191078 RepID=UPI002A7EED7E|nr:microsomal glutathione S-transferase 1-like isoform X2 [Saccostrea echinata]